MFNVPGRPTGSLRGPRSWFSLFAHRHLHVISHPFSPQFSVQENPRARDTTKGTRQSPSQTPPTGNFPAPVLILGLMSKGLYSRKGKGSQEVRANRLTNGWLRDPIRLPRA